MTEYKTALNDATDEQIWDELAARYKGRCFRDSADEDGWPIVVLPENIWMTVRSILPLGGGVLIPKNVFDNLEPELRDHVEAKGCMPDSYIIEDPEYRLELADDREAWPLCRLRDELGLPPLEEEG